MNTSQSKLDKYLMECDYLIQSFKQNPRQFINEFSKKKNGSQGNHINGGENEDEFESFGDLKKMMIKLFLELKEEEDGDDYCKYSVKIEGKLIEKLINKLGLSYLILNLYPNNEGYSIAIRKSTQDDDQIMETIKLPYEENELLDFIDNEELPPMLIDTFDTNNEEDYHIFYCGSIFIQVRDYRKNATNSSPYYESNFVRLRPTTQTILNDVIRLTSNTHSKKWTPEEKTALEAKLILETSEPLCLDPSPVVAIISNRLDYERKWPKSSKRIESLYKKSSQIALNRIKILESLPAPRGLELYDFLKSRNGRTSPTSRLSKKINNFTNKVCMEPIDPKHIQVDKFAKKLGPTSEDHSLAKFEEYIIEFVDLEGRSSKIVITIYYRSIDDAYFGQVFSEKLNYLSKSKNSSIFLIGQRSSVKKYVDQFTEILCDKGRVSLRITHTIASQAPRDMYTFSNESSNNEGCSLPKKPKNFSNSKSGNLNFIRKLV